MSWGLHGLNLSWGLHGWTAMVLRLRRHIGDRWVLYRRGRCRLRRGLHLSHCVCLSKARTVVRRHTAVQMLQMTGEVRITGVCCQRPGGNHGNWHASRTFRRVPDLAVCHLIGALRLLTWQYCFWSLKTNATIITRSWAVKLSRVTFCIFSSRSSSRASNKNCLVSMCHYITATWWRIVSMWDTVTVTQVCSINFNISALQVVATTTTTQW